MAGSRIKGITIEIDGNTTKLTEALKAVDKQVRGTESALRDVNKLLKMDPGNVDLLSQKEKYLGEAVEATWRKLDEEKAALEQLKAGPQTESTVKQQEALTREVAETTGKLKALTKEYENFGSVTGQKIAAAGDKVQKVGENISGVGTKLSMGVTAPIVAGAAAAVSSYGEVDKQFALVKQTMGETKNSAADFEGLWNQIGVSAKNSVFGMNDATNATLNFARQGFSAKQAADMLTPAMSLAAGTGTDLSEVTSGLGNSLKMFGADSSEAAGYADVLATAQAQANTNTSELFEAISIAGPVCKTVGWDVKDLAAVTGVFGNAGISGSEGANALKTGLARLAAPAKSGADAMDALGLSTGQTYAIFNNDGTLKSMPEVIGNLRGAFSGLTDQEKLEAASNIFGKNQMSKWLTLIQTSPEEVGGLRSSLDDVTGSANNMSDALMSGTGGQIEKLKSTFDVLKVTLGEAVAPAFTDVMEKVTDLMNKFMELDPKTQDLILKLAGIAAAAGPVLIVIGKVGEGVGTVMKLVPSIGGFIGKIGEVKGVFSSLWGVLTANPIGLIVVAIAGLVTAFVLLWNKSEAFRNFWKGLWEGIKTVATTVGGGIRDFLTGVWDAIFGNATRVLGNVGKVFSGKMEEVKTIVSKGLGKVSDFFSKLKLKLPKFKLPHFSLSGKLSLKPPSVPHISVKWYRKAYENAVMFRKPTVLAAVNGLKGFGDGAGSEIVVGQKQLMAMIADASNTDRTAQAVSAVGNRVIEALTAGKAGTDRMTAVVGQTGNRVIEAVRQCADKASSRQVVLDTGRLVGGIAPAMDKQLGIIAGRRKRG